MTYIPPTELLKISKVIRDNYIEMSAELAAIHGMYKKDGYGMPIDEGIEEEKPIKEAVVKDIGFYGEPSAVGYVGWIKTIDGCYFIDTAGKISKPKE